MKSIPRLMPAVLGFVLPFLMMRSVSWAATESALTLSNKTDIPVSVNTVGGGQIGNASLTVGLVVSEGMIQQGDVNFFITVTANYQSIATCSATVDTTMPALVTISGTNGSYSCSIKNDKVPAILNTNMENSATVPLTIVEQLTQDNKPLKSQIEQMAPETLLVVPDTLRSTDPVTVNDEVITTNGKLVASCSGTITFNNNLFYTTVSVVPNLQQPSGYSCSVW